MSIGIKITISPPITFGLETLTTFTNINKLAGLSRDCSIGYALNANKIDAILGVVNGMPHKADNGAASIMSTLHFDIKRMRITRKNLIAAAQFNR